MEHHLGNIIKKRLEEVGISKNEFARRINRTPQNVFSIFDRESMDTKLLLDISKVLNFDFFSVYNFKLRDTSGNIKNGISDISNIDSISDADLISILKSEILQLKKENDYLKEINLLLRDKLK
jgi:hypothetical protein